MDRKIVFPRSIRYLLAVAEHNSFTRAAEALAVSQPTLSQQIKQLEESLDVQLLDRSGRSVRLTDAGEVYLLHARRALGELNAAQRAIHDLQDLSRGSLRLGMTPITDYLTAPLLDAFNAHYPGISVSTLEMPQDDIETGVAEDRIDIGIAFTNTLSSMASSGKIEAHILFGEKLNLAVGHTHACAEEQSLLSAVTLANEPLVLLNSDFVLRRYVDMYCMQNGITPRVAMETNSLSVIVEIVRLGRLATILPNTIATAQHGICSVKLTPQLPNHTITLICRKGGYKSPACSAFGRLAADWCDARAQSQPEPDEAPVCHGLSDA
ncbi:MAG: transcriptional regulator CynR [Thiohalocapsa sp.]|jgi:LysR family cyn operon transcriptional activator|nr:transcriptional regulator CynR [Thiohalocapsa sp.]MCF7992195.1 transcriptional regulator CynR [Thiohalocapsa sp.]